MMSRSTAKRAPQPTRLYPLSLAVLVALTAVVAAACSAGSDHLNPPNTRVERSGAVYAAPAYSAPWAP
jgi:hypothetical protein